MPNPAVNPDLPRRLREQLIRHGLAMPEVEVCGLLGGIGQRLSHYYPVRNIAADPARFFLLDPQQQVAAMRHMRATGEELRGIFHSHPHGPAAPSDTDLAQAAYPDTYYFILSLAGTEPELACFHFDGQQFTAVQNISGE